MELAADSVGGRIQLPLGRRRRARPGLAGPSDQALHRLAGWYAIALRLGGAALFTAVAVLAATKQTSGWWLGTLLAALCLWSAYFTWRVRQSGLTLIVVLADAAVISALALAQQHVVPAVLIKDSTTWMLPLACTSVYILQIALRPWLGLPSAAIVVIAYGLGAGHPADAWLLVVETIVAAGLVAVVRGGARQADAQALLLWFQGMSKASVGRRMSISENTVRQYISRARAKYAATGRTAPSKDALLARAIEDGVIKPGEIKPYQSFAQVAADHPSLGAPGR